MALPRKVLMICRPDQLILEDDPAFMPDMALPALDYDFDLSSLNLNRSILGDSQGSLLDPYSQSRSLSSASKAGSVLGLVIPTSENSRMSYQLPQYDVSSAQKMSGVGRLYGEDEDALFDDFDFVFDADGRMVDVDPGERERLRTGSGIPQRLLSDSAASGRVLREHEDALAGHPYGAAFDADGDLIMQFADDQMILPDAEPFPAMTGARRHQQGSEASTPTEPSTVSIEASQRKRKRKVPKPLTADNQIELANSDLKSWQVNYLANMEAARHSKEVHRAHLKAKKYAYNLMWEQGIGGIGTSKYENPLGMFAGSKLREFITGIPTPLPRTRSPKHPRDEDEDEEDSEARRVRARQDQEEDQLGRGDEDALMPIYDDSLPLEVGRDAPAGLDDHPSSAMPWNISASLHSFRNLPPGSSSIIGRGTLPGRQSSLLGARPGSRLTSASPLIGRGRADLPDLPPSDDYELLGLESPDAPVGRGRTLSMTASAREAYEAEEFELFGPTAGVDTQTAQSHAWIRDALATESLNFLDYVRNTIEEQALAERDEDDLLLGEGLPGEERREVGFEVLFPPESNTAMVAAQAFHHVLTLATRDLLWVRQEEVGEVEFGEIWMGVKTPAAVPVAA